MKSSPGNKVQLTSSECYEIITALDARYKSLEALDVDESVKLKLIRLIDEMGQLWIKVRNTELITAWELRKIRDHNANRLEQGRIGDTND